MLLPEHVPLGDARLEHVGPVVRAPAGAVGVSVTLTFVSVSPPVLVTANW
jgi:hypothetical protein